MLEEKTKVCTICQIPKTLDLFGKYKKNKDGLHTQCKECRNKKSRANRAKKSPEERSKIYRRTKKWRKEYYNSGKGIEVSRRAHLKTKFNITLEEYNELLEKQNGVCAICGGEEMNRKNKVLAVDHCHETNIIRGLLCGHCNIGIGNLKDDVKLLKKAIKYLENYEKRT